MNERISGSFDVKMTPQTVPEGTPDVGIGRMSLDKRYRGPLDATSVGAMLAAMTGTPGSAGYVALERVDGRLDGRAGTFVLQHSGTMDRGIPLLSVTVVPDSGTGELSGLAGRMNIRIEDGKHFYDFDYTLGPPAAATA